jgi:hypothetical protein
MLVTARAVSLLQVLAAIRADGAEWLRRIVGGLGHVERPERRSGTPVFWQTLLEGIVIFYRFHEGQLTVLWAEEDVEAFASLANVPRNEDTVTAASQ